MKKSVQVTLNDDTRPIVESIVNQASADFRNGRISVSDVINEMILNSKVDVKALQSKHVNLRKSLRLLAARKDLDPDLVHQFLEELKQRPAKKVKANGPEKETQ